MANEKSLQNQDFVTAKKHSRIELMEGYFLTLHWSELIDSDYLNIEELSKLIDKPVSDILGLVESYEIPFLTLDGETVFDKMEIELWQKGYPVSSIFEGMSGNDFQVPGRRFDD